MADLEQLRDELREMSPQVCITSLDVGDYASIASTLKSCAEQLGGLDIVVINAGIGTPAKVGEGKFAQMRAVIDINLNGAIATGEATVELFRKQGHGHLVGVSSVAKVRGMPGQGAYSASKAGFSRYLESMRCELFDEPITVTELAPGYIDTDLNRNIENRPFLVTAEKGTKIMADLIEKQVDFSYVPPWPWKLVAQFMKSVPTSMARKM
jgi:NAD(P)-dependent dehydrogenase (short-subunit alcohol dehydrogenase family)